MWRLHPLGKLPQELEAEALLQGSSGPGGGWLLQHRVIRDVSTDLFYIQA
jgi:hypothetical protein